MTEREYCDQLRKYTATYRVQRNSDRIFIISGRYGSIQSFSVLNPGTLLAVGVFPTARCMTARLKMIYQTGIKIALTQVGDQECCFTFNEVDLDKLQKPLKLYRRRKDYRGRT